MEFKWRNNPESNRPNIFRQQDLLEPDKEAKLVSWWTNSPPQISSTAAI